MLSGGNTGKPVRRSSAHASYGCTIPRWIHFCVAMRCSVPLYATAASLMNALTTESDGGATSDARVLRLYVESYISIDSRRAASYAAFAFPVAQPRMYASDLRNATSAAVITQPGKLSLFRNMAALSREKCALSTVAG